MNVSESVTYQSNLVCHILNRQFLYFCDKKIKNCEKQGALFVTNSSYSSNAPFTMLEIRRRLPKLKRFMELLSGSVRRSCACATHASV